MHELKSRSKGTKTQQDPLSELIGRGILVGAGIVLLQADGFRSAFTTILGSVLTFGPIVTVGPIETLLKLSFNRITRKVEGKEVFIVEQSNIQAQMVIGQHFGDIIQPSSEFPKEENWRVARNFTLRGGDQEWETFPLDLKQGQSVKGHFDAEDDVWAYILTPSGLKSFERGDGFTPHWEAEQSDYAAVEFEAEKSGMHYLVIANFDPEEDSEHYEDEEDVSVELRLKF